jgi:hypothetical protein
LHHPHKNGRRQPALRLAAGAEPCDQECPTGISSPSYEVASRLAGALACARGR